MFIEFLPLEISDFIEELAEKYNLDKNLENDPFIREALLEAESIGEKQFIKIIYAKEIFPSLMLRDILKDYLNKKIQPDRLEEEIKKILLMEDNLSMLIFQDILNNPLINDILEEPYQEFDIIKENAKDAPNINKGGLSQELQ